MLTILRKCYICGLEATSEDDLEKFSQGNTYHKYGRQNLCKKYRNERRRLGGEWDVSKLDSRKIYAKKYSKRIIRFNDKRIHIDFDPRTNICSNCLKIYPDELKTQTFIHHELYDKNNPMDNTIELCASCHTKYHLLSTPNNCFNKDYIKYSLREGNTIG